MQGRHPLWVLPGMVLFATGDGTAGFGFTIKVEDVPVPDQEFPVRVEVYRGFSGESKPPADPARR